MHARSIRTLVAATRHRRIPPHDACITPQQVPVPPGLSSLELDVIKLTAQFVARNGKAFLNGLVQREQTSVQFAFLKPTHSLFSFFTQLCDAYSRVLMPPKDMHIQLCKAAADRCVDV